MRACVKWAHLVHIAAHNNRDRTHKIVIEGSGVRSLLALTFCLFHSENSLDHERSKSCTRSSVSHSETTNTERGCDGGEFQEIENRSLFVRCRSVAGATRVGSEHRGRTASRVHAVRRSRDARERRDSTGPDLLAGHLCRGRHAASADPEPWKTRARRGRHDPPRFRHAAYRTAVGRGHLRDPRVRRRTRRTCCERAV